MRPLLLLAQIITDPSEVGLPSVDANETLISDKVIPAVGVIAAMVCIIFIIIGGFRYVAAAGAPEQLQQAKHTILYAIVGLIVTLWAVTIVVFVVNSV